ncbi:AAA family ATPase [Lacticaseibacillus suibinensis]|uniref:AAA family ATPase n=1 Tax=Lacticaseibacillus suibinensis TaxID=2486011 RepID=UPI00194252E5|nr:SMC family ATPase [Lacticaseibacillus suibinensis]
MQLLDLHMQYFGPYRDETVDFASFAQTPLFLISGKTGSGKTTIFDALVFALYGDTSGDDRTGDEMRANFASADEKTRVTLRFTHGGKTYEIWREPAQELAKKRGNGTTTTTMNVCLTVFEDGKETALWTKKRDVAPRIADLLHLDADQFRQIVILPQGKFRQFLDANSDDKGALLQHLFGTSLYARWQTTLKTKAKQKQTAVAKQTARLQTLASQFQFEDPAPAPETPLPEQIKAMTATIDALTVKYTAAAAALKTAKAAYETANQAYQKGVSLQQAFQQQTTAQAALAALDAQAPALAEQQKQRTKLQWVQTHRSDYDHLQQAQADLTRLNERIKQTLAAQTQANAALAAATATADQLASQQATMTAQQKRADQLATLQPQLEQVATLQAAEVKAKAADQLAQTKLQQASTQVTATNEALTATQVALNALVSDDQQPALQAASERLAAQTPVYQQWQSTNQELAQTQTQLVAATTQAQTTKHAAEAASAHYTALHDAQLNNQIAALAAQLSPDAPCPVCGSTTHPHPATTAVAVVTAEAVDAADQKRQQAQKQATAAQAEATQLAAQVTKLTAQQAELAAQLSADGAVEAAYQQLTSQVATLKQAVATATAKRNQLEQQQATQAQALTAAQASQTAAQTQAHQAETAAASAQAALTTAQAALPANAPALADLKQEHQTITAELDRYAQAQKDNQAALSTAKEAAAEHKATLASQQSQRQQEQTTAAQAQLAFAETKTAALGAERPFSDWLKQLPDLVQLENALATAKTQRDQQTALLEQAARVINGQAQPDMEALQTARQAAATAQDQAQTTAFTLDQKLIRDQELHGTISKDFASNQTALDEAVAWDNLAQVLSGTNSRKLSLERFVLRAYLAEVLKVANVRLAKLTAGRYQFVLHDEPGSYRNDSGLEIDVYDDQVGQTRSVHTLSGGESFIAALSLALALGEVIQQEAGGVSIDALFVDEGFGSLDMGSLNVAMEALESIEVQARMIGIISHVAELQETVPDQLQVTADGNGQSHLKAVHADR